MWIGRKDILDRTKGLFENKRKCGVVIATLTPTYGSFFLTPRLRVAWVKITFKKVFTCIIFVTVIF